MLGHLREGVRGEDIECDAIEKWELGTEELRLRIFSICESDCGLVIAPYYSESDFLSKV